MIPLSWRSSWCVLAIIASSCLSVRSVRAEVVCDPDDPTRCSQAILRGQKALLDGQLMSTNLAIYLGQAANSCQERTAIEINRAVGKIQIDLKMEQQLRAIDAENYRERSQLLKNRLKAVEDPPWYKEVEVIWVFGIVVGVAATVGAYHLAALHVQGVQE